MSGKKVGIDYGPKMNTFMNDVKKTVVQQPDFRGIGGHGLQNHGNHGPHTQTSIGIGKNTTVNFREIKK